jgi:hypothetical protein
VTSGSLPTVASTIADVSEGFCPLCRVRLIAHDGQACCPCGGCSYKLEGNTLELTTCQLHPPVRCQHWIRVMNERLPADRLGG